MKSLKEWFTAPPPPKTRMGLRHPAPRFSVLHWSGTAMKQDAIKDISASGVYVLTEDRWEPGTPVDLTLHREDLVDAGPDHEFTLHAKAVRAGQDGVAFAFNLPNDIDPPAWVSLVEGASGEASPDDIIWPFKTAKAVSFLNHLCPNAEKEFRQKICNDLSTGRFAHAIEIALKAETILASWPDCEGMRANSMLLARILEYGSWAEDGATQDLWAGLLANSCAAPGEVDTYLDYVDRFSQFASVHVHMFVTSCSRAKKVLSPTGELCAERNTASMEEMMSIAMGKDRGRIERDLLHLFDLGLLERKTVPSFYLPVDEFDLTPTNLALTIYARCHAHRGAPESFYGLRAPMAPSVP